MNTYSMHVLLFAIAINQFIDLRESTLAADVRFLVIWLAFARFSDSIVLARRVSNALLTQCRLDWRSRGTRCREEIG